MKSIDELRKTADECTTMAGVENKFETVWITKEPFMKMLDAIEHEVEERYVEGPTDKNGDRITYDTMIHQWGALEYIACEVHTDGTHEWFVRGHDISAPLLKANDVEVYKPPTVEDVLRDFAYCCEEGATEQSIDEIVVEYAAKLQIRED